MRVSLFTLLVVLTGCATSAPEIVMSPPATVEVVTLELEIVAVTPPPVIEELEARTPVPAPRGVIRSRSEFPSSRVTEWTLVNGLTVVYREDPDLEGYYASLSAASLPFYYDGAVLEDGVRLHPSLSHATLASPRLSVVLEDVEGLFAGLPPRPIVSDFHEVVLSPDPSALETDASEKSALGPPSAYTLVMTGPAGREWIERDVAVRLSAIVGTGRLADSTSRTVPSTWTASVDWDEWPALWLAQEVISMRYTPAMAWYDAATETATVSFPGANASRAASSFQPIPEDAFREFRQSVAQRASSPHGVVDALATLYSVPGSFRPARPPIEAVEIGQRVARTPSSRVFEIISRFAPVQ